MPDLTAAEIEARLKAIEDAWDARNPSCYFDGCGCCDSASFLLDLVKQQNVTLRECREERDTARADCLVLVDCYRTDNAPPRWLQDRVAMYPIDARTTTTDAER